MKIEYIAFNRVSHEEMDNSVNKVKKFIKINLSHKYKYEFEFENKIINQIEKTFNTEGFFGENICSLLGVIGENGSGKTRLIHDLISLLENPNNDFFNYIIVFNKNDQLYYLSNIEYIKYNFKISKYSKKKVDLQLLKALYSKVVDANNSHIGGKHTLDLTSNSEVFTEGLTQTDFQHKNAFNQIKLVSEYNDLLNINNQGYVKIPDAINIFSNLKVLENNDYTKLVESSLLIDSLLTSLLIDKKFKYNSFEDFKDTKIIKNKEIIKEDEKTKKDRVVEEYEEFIRIPFKVLGESFSRTKVKEFEIRYKKSSLKSNFKRLQILKDIFDSICEKMLMNILSYFPKKYKMDSRGFNPYTLYEEENLLIDINKFGEQIKEAFEDMEYLSSKFYFENEANVQDFEFGDEEEQRELIESIKPNLKSIFKEYYINQLEFKLDKDNYPIVTFKWEENLKQFFKHIEYLFINILKRNLYILPYETEIYEENLYLDFEDRLKEEFPIGFDEIEEVNEEKIKKYQIRNLIKRFKRVLKDYIKQQFLFIDIQMTTIVNLLQKSRVSNINSFVNVEISVYSKELKEYLGLFGNSFDKSLLLFSWRNMSSGEIAILNMLSKIKEIKDYILSSELKVEKSNNYTRDIGYRNLMLFVDEGDLYLHPQWQKKFLKIFLKATERILGDINIHIILTTHSPFIISDIPKENVLLLNHSAENKDYFSEGTFGANINELLANQFFIQDGLVGEFAKAKINDVVNILLEARDDESLENIYLNKKYYQDFIDIIAEPLIKQNVMEIFNSKIMEYELKLDPLIIQIKKKEDELNKLMSMWELKKNEKTNN